MEKGEIGKTELKGYRKSKGNDFLQRKKKINRSDLLVMYLVLKGIREMDECIRKLPVQ